MDPTPCRQPDHGFDVTRLSQVMPTTETTADEHGCTSAGRLIRQTLRDSDGLCESTSQAEYAGSIPVIGSPPNRANAAERRFCQRAGTYSIPTVSIRDHGLRWLPQAKLQSADPRDVTILT